MSFFIVAMVVAVLVFIIAAEIIILTIFVVLYKAKIRKCKFYKLYESVSTSYIQTNGQRHKKMKTKRRLIAINDTL